MDTATRVLNVRIDPMTIQGALAGLHTMVRERRSAAVHLCNAWTAVLAGGDASYAEAINAGELNLADGKSMAWASWVLGARGAQERVCGRDLMLAACESGVHSGVRHFLYGGEPGVADNLADALRRRFPGIEIVGVESPPFRPLSPEEEDDLVQRLHTAGTDLVWVGLGTPKQDFFIERIRHRVDVGALLAVGAAFDFLCGRKATAPAWMQRSGLEWMFRLCSEPRRLWRRYLIGNAVFMSRLCLQLMRRMLAAPSRSHLKPVAEATAHHR